MRKWITLILTVVLILSCSIPVLAVEISDQTEITVNAKAEYNIEGEYPADIENGGATVHPDGDTTVTVTNAPNGAVRLIVTPIPNTEKDAWDWIIGCFKDKGTPIHAFVIRFIDENGNNVNADGAVVTIECSHCTGTPAVYSLTTESIVNELNSSNGTFTIAGNHYYVMAEKTSTPVDNRHKVEVEDITGGKLDISDKTPSTGDTVTVTPKPDNGKVMDKIIVTDKDGNKIEIKDNGDGSYSYEQPDGDVTIKVTFKDKNANVPPTGDNSHLVFWLTLAAVEMTVVLLMKKKEQPCRK